MKQVCSFESVIGILVCAVLQVQGSIRCIRTVGTECVPNSVNYREQCCDFLNLQCTANRVCEVRRETRNEPVVVHPVKITVLEGERAVLSCGAINLNGTTAVKWFHKGTAVKMLKSLSHWVSVREDGTLLINPVTSEDGGVYICERSNGIDPPVSASAILDVEYPARITKTPEFQYMPIGQPGIIQCYISSNPPIQFVTWVKDRRLLDPHNPENGMEILANGSLAIHNVSESNAGEYSCTPYNVHGTMGTSSKMKVRVKQPRRIPLTHDASNDCRLQPCPDGFSCQEVILPMTSAADMTPEIPTSYLCAKTKGVETSEICPILCTALNCPPVKRPKVKHVDRVAHYCDCSKFECPIDQEPMSVKRRRPTGAKKNVET